MAPSKLYSLAPYVSKQNSCTKGTSLGCRLVPEMIPIAPNNAVLAVSRAETPTLDSTHFSSFWDVETPLRRNSEICHQCTHAETYSRLLFQKRSKSVHDKWPKDRVASETEKKQSTFWHLGRTRPWGDFPHLSCVSAHRGSSYVRVWGSYSR